MPRTSISASGAKVCPAFSMRRSPLKTWRNGEWRAFRADLEARQYDLVIDAQGLLKSAAVTRLANGPKWGLDRNSAREGLSARVLDHPVVVPRRKHAITRVRLLFAAALGYECPRGAPDYGLQRERAPQALEQGAHLAFFHGTTWETKHWPEPFWRQLLEKAQAHGCQVSLPWGSEVERQRAERLADGLPAVTVWPAMGLDALLERLMAVDGFVAVDTGLAHLAAACDVPGVALYGPTDPALTGVRGAHARSLTAEFPCAPCLQEKCRYRGDLGKGVTPPCFSSLTTEYVWQQLFQQMSAAL